jgi:hypothetical protein
MLPFQLSGEGILDDISLKRINTQHRSVTSFHPTKHHPLQTIVLCGFPQMLLHILCSPLLTIFPTHYLYDDLRNVIPCTLTTDRVFQRKMLSPYLTKNIPLKYWYLPTRLQGSTKQKIIFIHYSLLSHAVMVWFYTKLQI